jgi:hypothetical protein
VERVPGVRAGRSLGVAAVVLGAVVAACGDDDDATPTTTSTPATTELATTVPATTDPATTSSPPTTAAPTTTVDVETLKAQIAADYLKTAQAIKALTRDPTLDRLEDRLAEIAVPGSYVFDAVRTNVQSLVSKGQHVAPGTPDYSDTIVEDVELLGAPSQGRAEVTVCLVTNQVLVDSSGQQVGGLSSVTAAKVREPMQRTRDGWRQSDQGTRVSIQDGKTCAP